MHGHMNVKLAQRVFYEGYVISMECPGGPG